jgi:hypothetical protein
VRDLRLRVGAGADAGATAYTVESIESDDPPQVICDYCVEEHYPETFAELLEERRRFRLG